MCNKTGCHHAIRNVSQTRQLVLKAQFTWLWFSFKCVPCSLSVLQGHSEAELVGSAGIQNPILRVSGVGRSTLVISGTPLALGHVVSSFSVSVVSLCAKPDFCLNTVFLKVQFYLPRFSKLKLHFFFFRVTDVQHWACVVMPCSERIPSSQIGIQEGGICWFHSTSKPGVETGSCL